MASFYSLSCTHFQMKKYDNLLISTTCEDEYFDESFIIDRMFEEIVIKVNSLYYSEQPLHKTKKTSLLLDTSNPITIFDLHHYLSETSKQQTDEKSTIFCDCRFIYQQLKSPSGYAKIIHDWQQKPSVQTDPNGFHHWRKINTISPVIFKLTYSHKEAKLHLMDEKTGNLDLFEFTVSKHYIPPSNLFTSAFVCTCSLYNPILDQCKNEDNITVHFFTLHSSKIFLREICNLLLLKSPSCLLEDNSDEHIQLSSVVHPYIEVRFIYVIVEEDLAKHHQVYVNITDNIFHYRDIARKRMNSSRTYYSLKLSYFHRVNKLHVEFMDDSCYPHDAIYIHKHKTRVKAWIPILLHHINLKLS